MSKTLTFTEADFNLLNLIMSMDDFSNVCGRILSQHFEEDSEALEEDGTTEIAIARYVYERMLNRDKKDHGSEV